MPPRDRTPPPDEPTPAAGRRPPSRRIVEAVAPPARPRGPREVSSPRPVAPPPRANAPAAPTRNEPPKAAPAPARRQIKSTDANPAQRERLVPRPIKPTRPGGTQPRKPKSRRSGPEPTVAPSDICAVLFADDAIVVVDKRAGFPCVPAGSHQRRSVLLTLAELGFGTLFPISLLDAEATGLVMFSRSEDAAKALRWNWRSNLCKRQYVVVVHGDIPGGRGRITLHIGALRTATGMRHDVLAPENGGRPAVTQWRLIARGRGLSRLLVTMETARTHQIRIHFAAVGHPVVNDRLYSRAMTDVPLHALVELPAKYRDATVLPPNHIGVHCSRIAMPHPVTNDRIEFAAPAPRVLLGLMPGAWIVDESIQT